MVDANNTTIQQQSNYYKDDFVLDLEKLYDDFITTIDSVRSYTNISVNFDFSTYLKSIDPTQQSSKVNLNIEKTPQESRCHAFFRLIGFPVMSNSSGFYNPGHQAPMPAAKFAKKIKIAGDPLDGFFNFSIAREKYYNNITGNIFANNTSILASVLSLASGSNGSDGINKRFFSAPYIASADAFDTSTPSYSLGKTAFVGNKAIQLNNFVDGSGNTANQYNSSSFKHLIKPFLVDPRIELTIQPSYDPTSKQQFSRRVAIPFLPDKPSTRVDANSYARRPLLEKTLIDRLNNSAQQGAVGSVQNVIDYINSVPYVADIPLLQNIATNQYTLTEQTKFEETLKMIRSLMKILVDASHKISQVQSLYYYTPIPSTTGPENGLTVNNINITSNTDFVTTADNAIILQTARSLINNINPQTENVDQNIDSGGFSPDIYDITFNKDNSDGVKDNATKNLDSLSRTRTKLMTDANTALRNFEIIMGEFSGLGLCDIIAIMGALYLVPIDSLKAMLDPDSLILAQQYFNQPTLSSSTSISTAMQNYTDTVSSFYTLMDQMFVDALINNGTM